MAKQIKPSTKPASQDTANSLHDILFKVLIEQVGERVVEEADEEEGVEAREFYTATPALLTVALKALKDNDTTCLNEEGGKTDELRSELAARKKGHGNVIRIKPEPDQAVI